MLVPLATCSVDIVQGYKVGRGDPWYRKVIGRVYHHGVKLMFGLRRPRHRLRLPAVPSPPLHRRPLSVDEWGDLRRDDVPVPARRGTVRRGASAPLLPPPRALAVLQAAGDRPQRAAVAHAVVAAGDPWTLIPKHPAGGAIVGDARRIRLGRALDDVDRMADRLLIVMVIGRDQWFARDDWAFIFTRAAAARDGGSRRDAARAAGRALDDVADPRLPRRCTASSGTRSYLPYLLVLWATHVGVVVLATCGCGGSVSPHGSRP